MSEGKNLGNFVLFIGLILVGASISYTGIQYLLSGTAAEAGAPIWVFLAVIAVGIALAIAGALLARRYL